MKVTDVRTLVVGNPRWKNRVFVIAGLDEEAEREHPFSPSNFLRLFRPGWKQRTVAAEAREDAGEARGT